MKRFAALVAAAAMVLLAVVLRGMIDGDEGSDGAQHGSGARSDLRVICGPELRAACDAIAESADGVSVTEQAEQETANDLASGELTLGEHTAWLAAGDWPAITSAGMGSGDDGSQRLELASSAVLARSPAVVVGATERVEAAGSKCGTVDWSCLGAAAGSPWTEVGGEARWGDVKVSVADVDSAAGMVTVNQAVASRVGSSDFATNDVEQPAVAGWFEHFARESADDAGAQELLRRLIVEKGSLSMVGVLESDAVHELANTPSAGSFTVMVPEPVATADVRLWAENDQMLDHALERLGARNLTGALGRAGWRIPTKGGTAYPPPGDANIEADMSSFDVALPGKPGLPSPGTTFTVNRSWREHQ